MEDKKPKNLSELNKLNPGTKKLLIGSVILISSAGLVISGMKIYEHKKANEAYTTTETLSGRMTALSNSFYDNESTLISSFTKNSNHFEPYAVYSIGSTLSYTDPEGSVYKLFPISGENKSKINYFRLEDGTFLRSVFNENNDLIVSNTQIKDTNELDLWTRFDKLQEEIGSSITKTDKIDLSKFAEIEKLMNQNPKLKN